MYYYCNLLDELKLRNKKRQDQIKREEKARKMANMKQKQRQEQEIPAREQQSMIENDPFFRTYQPISEEENEAMLKLALETSALEAQELQRQQQEKPKTVWGTPAITTQQQEEEIPQEWADHIVITQGRKKNKKKHK